VKGTVTAARVTGTIQGNSMRTKVNGQVVRCTFGPLNWSAVDRRSAAAKGAGAGAASAVPSAHHGSASVSANRRGRL
jgi:hypothetical protein